MFHISLLAFSLVVFFIAVTADESQGRELSKTMSDLESLKRDVRSQGVSTKKKFKKGEKKVIRKKRKFKKREKKASRKKKKGQNSRRTKVKNNPNRPKKKSGSKQGRRMDNGKKNSQRKTKSKKSKPKRKNKNKPLKIKIAKKNKRRRTNRHKCNRQNGTDDATCWDNIKTSLDYEGLKKKNFINQIKRISSFQKPMKSKTLKKDNFKNTTSYMKEALGSDNSRKGAYNTTDAETAVLTHAILSKCSTSVETGCSIPSNTYNSTELALCESRFTAVMTKNEECWNLTQKTSPDLSAACTCWAAAATLVKKTQAFQCSASNEFKRMKALKKTCFDNFSECKKAEDESVGLIQVCNGRTTPSTAFVSSPPSAAPSPIASESAAAALVPSATAAAAVLPSATSAAALVPSATAAAALVQSATATAAAPATTAADCKCGIKKTRRIVGGKETEINEYPWMAAITNAAERFFCGGTLITSQWVLTATHCMWKDQEATQEVGVTEIRVVLGDHDNTISTENIIPRIVKEVSQIERHPKYSYVTSDYDIALIKLKDEVDLKVYTPACLPAFGDTFVGQKAWVYGWGTTSFGGSVSNKLLEVQVPVVSKQLCKQIMQNTITNRMLCAGGELNKDGCQGDSGGPLTVEKDGKHYLIGDVSFGNGCGQQGQYGVYGNVAFFRDTFINTTIEDAKNCA